MKSIRGRLVVYFMLVIVITVVFLEVLMITTVRQNYYKNLEVSMYNQIRISSDLYLRYFSDTTLYDNVLNNVDNFWKQNTAQVQIIDLSGRVLMDSIGITPSDVSRAGDVKRALQGEMGSWTGNVYYDTSPVMAVSYPLKSDGKIVGVLRFISTLSEINKEIYRVVLIFIGIGLLVIVLSGVLSYFLSHSIIGPVKEVTRAAEQMAAGNFTVRSQKRHDDEIGKLSDTLNYMAKEILEKDELKNSFIASVSHELRTPLTAIKGWAITLKDVDPKDREVMGDGLDIIEAESDRLTVMVEELLDFSKFISSKVSLSREEVHLEELLAQLQTLLIPRAQRDDIHFEMACEEGLPVINSDSGRLKQLFLNILDNAFKFTPSGGSISFTSQRKGSSLVFCIKDTGLGISEEDLPRVKEKFYKGKSSKSQNGIGLSICDEIVKLMDGKLEIRSEINQGTEVCITLPL